MRAFVVGFVLVWFGMTPFLASLVNDAKVGQILATFVVWSALGGCVVFTVHQATGWVDAWMERRWPRWKES